MKSWLFKNFEPSLVFKNPFKLEIYVSNVTNCKSGGKMFDGCQQLNTLIKDHALPYHHFGLSSNSYRSWSQK
jgi:hypothetical protein